uniref:Immunoglobulin subtype domain-containing protein n=1 Tax=Neolamprologus brichardi TaxID=32507 RepID=A0A3Q4GIY5_NEOBR
METSAGFWLLAVLLLAATSFSQDQTVKYIRVGDTLQLSPEPVSEQIYSGVWKYGRTLLAEWVQDAIPLTYYSKFKRRTSLNTDTGVLEIRNMTVADSGVYSVEINNQLQSRVYKIVAIEAVPQPEVNVTPLLSVMETRIKMGLLRTSGRRMMESGSSQERRWRSSMMRKQRVKTFSCRMKNLYSLTVITLSLFECLCAFFNGVNKGLRCSYTD